MAKDKWMGTGGLQYKQAKNWFAELESVKVLSETQQTQLKDVCRSIIEYLGDIEIDAFAFKDLESNSKITVAQYKLVREKEKERLKK